MKRAIVIVVDSMGCGAMPDAAEFNDLPTCNTLAHVAHANGGLNVPNFEKMGLGNIIDIEGVKKVENPTAQYGILQEISKGKCTTTGHWEMMGHILDNPFKVYTESGFPKEIIDEFVKRTGCGGVLGNKAASGTVILDELHEEHEKTKKPIVYTSADSVFQIAADTSVIPLERLYEMCRIARNMLTGDLLVGRVIARPFIMKDGQCIRTSDRRDYALEPFGRTVLDDISDAGMEVCAVGKIIDIFNGRGITSSVHTEDNMDGVDKTLEYMNKCKNGLIFTNLVDFDAKYGHRRDPEGYARALEEFDARIPELTRKMRDDDVLVICADHGNDPVHTGWNHTREYVPVMVCGRHIKQDVELGTLTSFACIGAFTAEYLGLQADIAGKSFLKRIQE